MLGPLRFNLDITFQLQHIQGELQYGQSTRGAVREILHRNIKCSKSNCAISLKGYQVQGLQP